jgi:hypothetical protein
MKPKKTSKTAAKKKAVTKELNPVLLAEGQEIARDFSSASGALAVIFDGSGSMSSPREKLNANLIVLFALNVLAKRTKLDCIVIVTFEGGSTKIVLPTKPENLMIYPCSGQEGVADTLKTHKATLAGRKTFFLTDTTLTALHDFAALAASGIESLDLHRNPDNVKYAALDWLTTPAPLRFFPVGVGVKAQPIATAKDAVHYILGDKTLGVTAQAAVHLVGAKTYPVKSVEEPDWEARFRALAEAVELLSETAVFSDGRCTPSSEAWHHLAEAAKHYSAPNRVKKLRLPALPSEV